MIIIKIITTTVKTINNESVQKYVHTHTLTLTFIMNVCKGEICTVWILLKLSFYSYTLTSHAIPLLIYILYKLYTNA